MGEEVRIESVSCSASVLHTASSTLIRNHNQCDETSQEDHSRPLLVSQQAGNQVCSLFATLSQQIVCTGSLTLQSYVSGLIVF